MENRVIKFRVYILDNSGKVKCYFHEWLDGDGWKHDYYAPIVCNGVFNHEELGDGFLGQIIRKQFTGLTDKNGVEIYEGDVVRNWQGGWNVVVYKAPGFEATVSENESSLYTEEWWRSSEVIGNIYENPELLNP